MRQRAAGRGLFILCSVCLLEVLPTIMPLKILIAVLMHKDTELMLSIKTSQSFPNFWRGIINVQCSFIYRSVGLLHLMSDLSWFKLSAEKETIHSQTLIHTQKEKKKKEKEKGGGGGFEINSCNTGRKVTQPLKKVKSSLYHCCSGANHLFQYQKSCYVVSSWCCWRLLKCWYVNLIWRICKLWN